MTSTCESHQWPHPFSPNHFVGTGALGRQSGHGCRQRPVPSQLHTFISNDEEKKEGSDPFQIEAVSFRGA